MIRSILEAVQAVEFVLSEIARIEAMSIEGRMARIRADPREGFGVLSAHPEYMHLECGIAALGRLHELTQYLLTLNNHVSQNASFETVHKKFEWRFLDNFVKHRHSVNKSSVSSVLHKTGNDVAAEMALRTIVIPCVLWQWEEPSHFVVGPVDFYRAKGFFSDPMNPLTHADESPSQRARALAEEAGWVAVVAVSTMDDDTAERRARVCVDAAINVQKLFIDPHRTRECRRADSWGPAPDFSVFRRQQDGTLAVRLTFRGSEALAWKNWAECYEGQTGALHTIAQAAVTGLLEASPPYPLQRRLLDALRWFGDGVSETSLAARIAKYVFAWERLVITRKYSDPNGPTLTASVCRRVAALCDRMTGNPKGFELLKVVEHIYDVRSRLAHGSASPHDDQKLRLDARKAEEITVRLLFGAIYQYWLLKQGGASDEELEQRLTTLSEQIA